MLVLAMLARPGEVGMSESALAGDLHLLLVEGDAELEAAMRTALLRAEAQVRVRTVRRLGAALDALRDPRIGCVVTDLVLADAEGSAVVRALRAARAELPVVAVAAAGSEELAVAALKLGAAEYLPRHPDWLEHLPVLVRAAIGRSVLSGIDGDGGGSEAAVAGGWEPFVATTASMRTVLDLVLRAARSRVPVLVEGETGTGKEVVARAVHQRSAEGGEPFLVQNCAAIAEPLLESELFGHLRGAFTGASRDRSGLFLEAGRGTVFLDEIAEAPPSVQARLLRVLQHEEVKAVGADRTRPVRARIIAASNRPLEDEVRAGRFRRDLYYRLAVFPIRIPPLRHRTADVPMLARHFLRSAEAREARTTGGFDTDVLEVLRSYAWPGNVRELENEIHRLVLSLRPGDRIRRYHLARRIRDAEAAHCGEPLARILARVELALIRERLARTATKSAAARSLGITREALYAKMRRLGMR
jgi:DNA-binding NtrC family response regulator